MLNNDGYSYTLSKQAQDTLYRMQQDQHLKSLSNSLNNQASIQGGMNRAIINLVRTQSEANKIMQLQHDELKRQNDMLYSQNKRQTNVQWITYSITTAIAIASLISQFI